jgi:hypothetical protein
MAVESRFLHQLLIRVVSMRAHVPLYHQEWRVVLPDSRRGRLGGTVVVAPVIVEAWMLVMAGVTGVVSFCTTAPMPPYTVRGHACTIHGHARQKYAKGVGRSHDYVAGVGRGEDCSRQGRCA